MKIKIVLLIFSLSGFTTLTSFGQRIDSIWVFILAGQSNMKGFGLVSELPDSLNKTFDQIWIFDGQAVGDAKQGGGLGIWAPLAPGHGSGFASDGVKNTYSARFGAELALAYTLRQKYPNQKMAFIKYARNGSSIDTSAIGKFGCWQTPWPGKHEPNQLDHFKSTFQNATQTADIEKNGAPDVLVPKGIYWMQGESDASFTEEIALRYLDNLSALMHSIRATIGDTNTPVVLGKISDSRRDEDGRVYDYGELVQYAQEKFAKTDHHAEIVRNTRFYAFSDTWHFDSNGYIDLGRAFAEAFIKLQE